MSRQKQPQKKRRSRHTTPESNGQVMSHTQGKAASPQPVRPTTDDRAAWKLYWQACNQPWRIMPEISPQRQNELDQRRAIVADVEKGLYPFRGAQLNRADVEWLLATHDGGRGPIDWSNVQDRARKGLDLCSVDLRGADLRGLPLACLQGGLTYRSLSGNTTEPLELAAVHMEEANLSGAQLQRAHLSGARLQRAILNRAQLQGAILREAQFQEAILSGAQLQGAILPKAQLQKAILNQAQLQGADLSEAQLQEADLSEAHLQGTNLINAKLDGADLSGAQLDGSYLINAKLDGADLSGAQLQRVNLNRAQLQGVDLTDVKLGDKQRVGPRLVDVQWGNSNLAVVDWSQITMLGDDREAHQKWRSDGTKKEKVRRLYDYQAAVRANRQLAVALQSQGLNEDAVRFAFRA